MELTDTRVRQPRTVTRTRSEITTMLDILEGSLPRMIANHSQEAEFCAEFARAADLIEDVAAHHDKAFVQWRVDRILSAHGLIPAMVRARRNARGE